MSLKLVNSNPEVQEKFHLNNEMQELLDSSIYAAEDFETDNRIFLKKTTLLTNEQLTCSKDSEENQQLVTALWNFIQGLYDSKNKFAQAAGSIFNACLTQNKTYFCISRSSIFALVKTDPNLKGWVMDNNRYSSLLKYFYSQKFIIKIDSSTTTQSGVFKLVFNPLLSYLWHPDQVGTDEVEQIKVWQAEQLLLTQQTLEKMKNKKTKGPKNNF